MLLPFPVNTEKFEIKKNHWDDKRKIGLCSIEVKRGNKKEVFKNPDQGNPSEFLIYDRKGKQNII